MSEVESPCIGRCGLTSEGLCIGCFRNVREIVSWSRLSNEQKAEVLKDLENRKPVIPNNQ